jgi:hypothetical protein
MAWEQFEQNGAAGYTGDAPVDSFALALRDIAKAYQNRFDRKPTLAEVLYSLANVLRANPAAYLADPDGIDFASLNAARDPNKKDGIVLDFTKWEAAYTDRTDPGYYVIFERKTPRVDAIKINKLEESGTTLLCEFETLAPGISDKMVESLVIESLLKAYAQNHYKKSCS